MRVPEPFGRCPFDSCPLPAFAVVKAPPGCTIALHGCRYCDFNYVLAVATDTCGNRRLIAQWSYNTDSGLYLLVKEYGPNPPGWIDLTCSALPERK
jgi:hypothetical protein